MTLSLGVMPCSGMGEVYRAKDSKLGRDVAIKVLPDESSRDKERLARFKRKAKVLASLNHPNIAAIYGLEESEGMHYLVLELVEGETLAERIARGPIPPDESREIAIKIAEALEAAHEQGIIHRDLKPANVMLTPNDKVKVLDFGLAKVFVEESTARDNSMSPTLTRLRQGSGGQARDATRMGVILGTAAYMSPEQAKGKKVDKRTDIFAFGAVLFEMLTARKAFAGEDVSEVLASVIKSEPDLKAVPSRFVGLVQRCLEKDSAERLRDIREARIALRGGESVERDDAPTSSRWVASAAAVVSAALASLVAWNLASDADVASSPPVTRFALDLPELNLNALRAGPMLAVSPDGSRLVYETAEQLYIRRFDELEARPLREPRAVTARFFRPMASGSLFSRRRYSENCR